jgi:hypothetical protein
MNSVGGLQVRKPRHRKSNLGRVCKEVMNFPREEGEEKKKKNLSFSKTKWGKTENCSSRIKFRAKYILAAQSKIKCYLKIS